MKTKILFLLIFIPVLCFAQGESPKKVAAIFPFHFASTNLEEKDAISELNGLFYDLFAGQLVSTDYFDVVDRQHIAEMMNEVALQQTGLTGGQVVELGKAKGAQLGIFGTVTKVGKQTFLTMKIIDIETTVILKSIKAKGSLKKPDELALEAGYKFMEGLTRILYQQYEIGTELMDSVSKEGLNYFLKGRDLIQQAIIAYDNDDMDKMKKLKQEGEKYFEKASKYEQLHSLVVGYKENVMGQLEEE